MEISFIPPRVWFFFLFLSVLVISNSLYKWSFQRKIKNRIAFLVNFKPELFESIIQHAFERDRIQSIIKEYDCFLAAQMKDGYLVWFENGMLSLHLPDRNNFRLPISEVNDKLRFFPGYNLTHLIKSFKNRKSKNPNYQTNGHYIEIHFFMQEGLISVTGLVLKFKVDNFFSKFI